MGLPGSKLAPNSAAGLSICWLAREALEVGGQEHVVVDGHGIALVV